MNVILGSSPATSIVGYLLMIVGMAGTLIQQGGVPHDPIGWIAFVGSLLIGIAGRLQKDANVSNATTPVPAKPVDSIIAPEVSK